MKKIISEDQNDGVTPDSKSGVSPDSALRAAVQATGMKPMTAREPRKIADTPISWAHEGLKGAVHEFSAKTGVDVAKSAAITADEFNDVDASGKDYREEVRVRPHMIPTEVGNKSTRYAKKKRGQSPGSYRGAKDMKSYKDKAPWAGVVTQCHALKRDGRSRCGHNSRPGSKFCHLFEHSSQKTGVPDYADEHREQLTEKADHEEDEGPLPESLQRPLMWVWGNFYTPFSWMVVWVFSVMMSAKGKFGQAICSGQLLMRYCTHSIACKWKWKQTIAILSQSMSRKHPLLGVNQAIEVLGTHEMTKRARRVDDAKLKARVASGVARQTDKGKWIGRNGAKWFKDAKGKWDELVTKRWEQNCLNAYMDPGGINARCFGLAELLKEDGTPHISAAKRKFKGQLITLSEVRKGSKKISAFFKSPDYEYCITKPTNLLIQVGPGKLTTYTKDKFVEKFIKLKAETFAAKYDVFYLVDNKARKPRGSKKGIQWVDDPVIVQCATYVEGDKAKLFLGVGRKTKAGHLTGPFESLFLRSRGRSAFTHVWDADDELDVLEVTPTAATNEAAMDGILAKLHDGKTLNWDDLMTVQQ
jgi:hypothetical protein